MISSMTLVKPAQASGTVTPTLNTYYVWGSGFGNYVNAATPAAAPVIVKRQGQLLRRLAPGVGNAPIPIGQMSVFHLRIGGQNGSAMRIMFPLSVRHILPVRQLAPVPIHMCPTPQQRAVFFPPVLSMRQARHVHAKLAMSSTPPEQAVCLPPFVPLLQRSPTLRIQLRSSMKMAHIAPQNQT